MSNYGTETTQVSVRTLNQAFLRAISDGHTKQAQDDGTNFIREIAREASAVRDIMKPIGLTDAELDPDDRTDQPRKIVEKEPQSYAASMEFRGQPNVNWVSGPRFSVYFMKIASLKSAKAKEELMTYRNDIRSIIAENNVKDCADVEDKIWNNLQMQAVAQAPAISNTIVDGFNPSAFKRGFQALLARRRPLGRLLMTKGLFMEAIDLPATTIGVEAERHYREGIEKETSLWGVPVTSTLKEDIYDPRSAWLYTPENFLGKFFTLQDATLFLKQEANIVEWYVYETIGMAIANRLAIQRIQFPERS